MAFFDTGGKIRDLRKERGLNQDQLAELASLNRVTIAKYESGRIEPGAQALSRIADALDVTVDMLLGKSDPAPKEPAFPKTPEARILAEGIDRLPKEQREQALSVMRAVFAQHADYFQMKGTDDDEP
jgi:transcriptional regulator with XRE-family HTH domain